MIPSNDIPSLRSYGSIMQALGIDECYAVPLRPPRRITNFVIHLLVRVLRRIVAERFLLDSVSFTLSFF